MCWPVIHFLVKLQILIFLSVCSRTPRNFTFFAKFGMANLFIDTIFHLLQYKKCQAVSKKGY